jgi:hypothetical protein
MFVGKAGAYPIEGPFKCSILGLTSLVALPTNNRLGWKGLPGTNSQAYYENSHLTVLKSFLTLAPDVKK